MVTVRQPDSGYGYQKSQGQAGSGQSSPAQNPANLIQPNVVQWSPALQTILDQPASSLPGYLWSAGFLFTVVFGAWAWLGSVDEVAKASGKLKPQGEVIRVNPLEMGRVARVNVREGSIVRAGDVLFELDTELIDREVERLETVRQSNIAQQLQLQTIAKQVQLEAQTKEAIAQTTFDAQQAALSQQKTLVASRKEFLVQLGVDASAQSERLDRLRFYVKEGAIAKEMLFQGESGLRDRQRSMTETQGSVQQALAEIHNLNVGLVQKRAEAQQINLAAQQQIEQMRLQITELQAKINETKVMISAAKASRKQRFIYAPASGKILTLNTKNRGEVLQPGQNMAEIAPKAMPIVLSTLIPSRQAGFIKVGMAVKVKLDAYPYQDYGILPGRVVSLSPDSKPVEGMGEVYRLDVSLNKDFINVRGHKTILQPGQTATAEIITRHRRILDVLVDPIKKLKGGVSL
jgi:hemolysin D